MNSIRIKCPAKVNLTLEVVNRREDGFHNIKSIMQTISLYDFLDIKVEPSNELAISLSGTSKDIPYDEKNLVYKAAKLFFENFNSDNFSVEIFIEKNIPIAAGLAGGSTDGAGTIFGLNEIFNRPFDEEKLNEMCAKLGSDLNVCLIGGTILATSRGEITKKLKPINSPITLIKPKNLGISAKEAYTKYALKEFKPQNNMTEKMIEAINKGQNISEFLYNDLEYAIFDDYKELQAIKKSVPQSIMSGSGSTYFVLDKTINAKLNSDYQIYDNLEFTECGVSEV